jgi:predicted AAA+ superfamily ATPase
MQKEEILKILGDWNFWEKDQDTGICRTSYLNEIRRLGDNFVLALVGARRAGKSTILRQHLKELLRTVKRKRTLFVNFEDQRYTELNLQLLNDIYETYLQFVNPEKKPFLFLDEIHHISGWEKFVRSLHERKAAHIFVSGSSSKLLSEEFGTVLTGRHLDIEVFPLDFAEFLMFKGLHIKEKFEVYTKRVDLQRYFREYLEWGGFPEVILNKAKKDILLKYFEDVIQKDLINRYKLRQAEKLKTLAKYYLMNISSPTTFNSISKAQQIPINTVGRFSSLLDSVYLVFFVRRFSYSMKEQERSPRKVYCIDTGLRNVVCFRFLENLGQLAENAVFIHLRKSGKEIFYWKDRYDREVDFVVKEGLKVKELIQVCWDVSDRKTKERSIKSLVEAAKEFKIKTGIVLTENHSEELKAKGNTINLFLFMNGFCSIRLQRHNNSDKWNQSTQKRLLKWK